MIKSLLLSTILLTGCAANNYHLLEKNKTVPEKPLMVDPSTTTDQKIQFGWVVWIVIILFCLFLLVRERSKTSSE